MITITKFLNLMGYHLSYFRPNRTVEIGHLGCLPLILAKKSGNFGLRSNEKAIFGNCGQPPEVFVVFRSEWKSGNAHTICENSSVSRPFLTRSSKICRMNCAVVKW